MDKIRKRKDERNEYYATYKRKTNMMETIESLNAMFKSHTCTHELIRKLVVIFLLFLYIAAFAHLFSVFVVYVYCFSYYYCYYY